MARARQYREELPGARDAACIRVGQADRACWARSGDKPLLQQLTRLIIR
jgi:hypothetical protein